MRKNSLFSKERLVYWPEEFADVVNALTGRDSEGRPVGAPLYQYNTGAITLAASIGIKYKRKREIGNSRRKEISTVTFASHGLESFIFLIPLLVSGAAGTDILRPESEEEVIREFERYAAGGLEVLRGELEESAGKSADVLVQGIILRQDAERRRAADTTLPSII